jgi:hypothetical protein
VSLLDLIQVNILSKVLTSEFRSIEGLKDKIKADLTAKPKQDLRRTLRIATEKPLVNVRKVVQRGPLMSNRLVHKVSIIAPSMSNPGTKVPSRRLLKRSEDSKRAKSVAYKKA